jgi:phosphoribosylamine-glycine ligase
VLPAGQRNGVALDDVDFPAVVKPVGRHSSSGVAMVDDLDSLRQQLTTYPEHETLLVETKVIGQEYSVESLVQHGEVIFSSATRKDTNDTHTSNFVELAHTVPTTAPR